MYASCNRESDRFFCQPSKTETRGVTLFFRPLASGCGASLIGPSGEIKSPNFPNNYGNNQECTWQITVPVNKQVRLDFSDFKTESGKDVLQVFDTGSREPVITFSGTTYKPPPFTSSGRSLRIRLVTDGANTMKGFKLAYLQVGEFSVDNFLFNLYIICEIDRRDACSVPSWWKGFENSFNGIRSLS